MEITYKTTGVDFDCDNKINNHLEKILDIDLVKNFASLFYISKSNSQKNVALAATCDGVGTKIIPLLKYKMFKTIANDLVAMNFNDLATKGAYPLFFLDYIANNNISVESLKIFLTELNNILKKYNCKLLGGETSQMKDIIKESIFDVCGFVVGQSMVDANNEKKIEPSDIIVGLKSNGIHSNGFTLIRKLYETKQLSEIQLIETLKPTYIYLNEILELFKLNIIKKVANITGGGLYGNVSRIIPNGLRASISKNIVLNNMDNIFVKLINIIGEKEAFNVFNMGIGMVLVIDKCKYNIVKQICQKYNPIIIGEIIRDDENCNFCFK